jgi:hypothetical protein
MVRRSAAPFALVLAALLLSPSVVSAGNPAIEHAMAATFRVFVGSTSGTVVVVEVPGEKEDDKPQHLLVTAAHVFRNMQGEQATLVLRARKKDGSYERREVKIPIRNGKEPLWTKHPDNDLAALKVTLPADVDVRPLPLANVADEKWVTSGKIATADEVWVPCYPATLEANAAGWPVLRRGSVATYPLAPVKSAKTILVDYPNFGGDSGAPVIQIVDGKPMLVAIVQGMHRQTDKSSTAFEERTVHTPMSISYCGQACFLREVIESAMKK